MFTDPAHSITVDLDASQDNTLYEDPNGSLSNGAGPNFFAGRTLLDQVQRGLVKFDVAGGIPAGVTVSSATLTLYMSKEASGVSDNISLHRVGAAWGEEGSVATGGGGGGGAGGPAVAGDATWTHRISPTDAWVTPGGDFSGTASATKSVLGVGYHSWGSTTGIVGDIQGWLDDPNSNFGWLVLGNEVFSQSSKRFDAREHPNVSHRPVLTIEYEGGSLSADFNEDSFVDDVDLGIWEAAYGINDNGDTNGDNDSDGADFLNWQQQFTGPPPLRAVPEPTGAVLICVSFGLAAGTRYRLSMGT